ncbi:MAG TPA: LysR family transcriptional regulator [Myxococcota bacterium]|nr:LysR family transcriptional regulator [Myxococcota bacterium]
MVEQLEALRALRDSGTTALAAVRLRISQSAVSKRIAALEQHVGVALVRPSGRRIVLTPAGERLLTEATPLLLRLQELLEQRPEEQRELVLGAPESLMASWLPARLRGLRLELHVHRGPVLVERLRSGSLEAAICVDAGSFPELVVEPLGSEGMGLVGQVPAEGPLDLWTIEENSLTGAFLSRRWARLQRALGRELRVQRRLESFVVLARLAQEGFGVALVPEGIARALHIQEFQALPELDRPICLLTRPSHRDRPELQRLLDQLRGQAAR